MNRRPSILAVAATLLLSSTTVACLAQAGDDKVKVRVRISTDDDAKAKLRPISMVRSTANHVMMLRSGEFDVRAFGTLKSSLDLYDRNKLTYVRSQEPVTTASNGDEVKVDALVFFGGKPMLVGHGNNEATTTVYYQVQDPALTRFMRGYEPLVTFGAEVKERRPMVVSAGGALRQPYTVKVSNDSSYMMIASPEIRDKESRSAFYLMAVVDKQMNVLWQQVVDVNSAAKSSSLESAEVDDQGNVYFVVKNTLPSAETKGSKNKHELKVFVASGSGVEEAVIKLPGDAFATSATLQYTADDRVVCAGVYGSEEEKRSKKLGNFIYVLEAGSAEAENTVVIPFNGTGLEGESDDPDDTKATTKDKERMEYNTDVIAVLPRKDGSFYLVNEVFYISSYYDMQAKREVTRYVHGPVQVRLLEKDGTERWSTIFRRWVSSLTPVVGRVYCAEFNDQLFLFLLDSEEMAERRKAGDKITSRHIRDPYSASVAFDSKGGYKIKPVLRSDNGEDFISGWELVRVGPGEYFALGTEKLFGGRFLPVKIEFSLDGK
jgi:hypothetical protein